MSRGAYPEAETCFEASRALQPACWNLYALAICRYAQRDTEGGVPYLLEAMDRRPEDVSLARDVFRFLQECGQYDRIVERYTAFSTQLQQDGKLKFYLAPMPIWESWTKPRSSCMKTVVWWCRSSGRERCP